MTRLQTIIKHAYAMPGIASKHERQIGRAMKAAVPLHLRKKSTLTPGRLTDTGAPRRALVRAYITDWAAASDIAAALKSSGQAWASVTAVHNVLSSMEINNLAEKQREKHRWLWRAAA